MDIVIQQGRIFYKGRHTGQSKPVMTGTGMLFLTGERLKY